MSKPLPRTFTVTDFQRVSPSMHQVTLGGPAMRNFPAGQAGAYIKLLLKRPGLLPKPLMRTYTIRAQRDEAIDVQFALHGEDVAGPATQWALDADCGDTIMIGGPGPAKPFIADRDFYLIAGDMTALPAIAANLERLDGDAKGVAVIEIQHEDDAAFLDAPAGIDIQWIVNPEPGTRPELLADALRAVNVPDGSVAGWAACEFSSMQRLRELLRGDMALGPRDLYISSYWKHGVNESDHKKVKRKDAAQS